MDEQKRLELKEEVEKYTYVIHCYDIDGVCYNSGSATAFTEDGFLLTPLHVPHPELFNETIFYGMDNTKVKEVIESNLNDPIKIMGKSVKDEEFIEYELGTNYYLMFFSCFNKPFLLDVAVLRPKKDLKDVPHVSILEGRAGSCSSVLMAGFSTEARKAFDFSDEVCGMFEEKPPIVFKHGMVASAQTLRVVDIGDVKEFCFNVYYIDNQVNEGFSGGPVVNSDGELLGIITTRVGVTIKNISDDDELQYFEVTAGSALSISPPKLIKRGIK